MIFLCLLLWRIKQYSKLPHTNSTSETDSTTDTDFSPREHIQQKTHVIPIHLRDTFMTAMELKRQVQSSLPWLPTAKNLNMQEAERTIPNILYNFLAWIVGASENPDTEKRVEVSVHIHRKLLSILQDIISLGYRGRALMPKHLALAMAVCHFSGSAQLINLLNGSGHCVSHSIVLNPKNFHQHR